MLFAPVCFELVGDLIREHRAGASGRKYVLHSVGRCLSLLLIPMGLVLYLCLNYQLTGDWFRFLEYQRENWNQGLGWFFSTAEYQTVYGLTALREQSTVFYGLWLPSLIYLFGSIAILIAAQKSCVHPMWPISFFTMPSRWAPHGCCLPPRYLTAAFPLALGLAAITEKRWADALATTLCTAGLLYYLFAFLQHWSVY